MRGEPEGEPMNEVEDRAAGVVLGSLCGDAFGAGFALRTPPGSSEALTMGGDARRGLQPGEWTDGAAMAAPVLEIAAEGGRFDERDLDRVADRWLVRSRSAKGLGAHTRAVLDRARARDRPTAAGLLRASRAVARETGRAAGNASLARTAPLALAFLDDEDELVAAARRVSDLTHADRDAGDACVLWSVAIRQAVLTGDFDVRAGLQHVREPRRTVWRTWLDDAEAQPAPTSTGWVVGAFQAASAAIAHGRGLVDVLERTVRGGGDTAAVASIAGALVGAVEGAAAVPDAWRRMLHGPPGWTAEDAAALAVRAAASVGRAPQRPERALLETVRLLHSRGYEGVRVHAAFGGPGYWRCILMVETDGRELDVLRYSSAAQWDLVGDGGTGPRPVARIADALERHPELRLARSPDPGYRFWFAALLEHCGPARVPYLNDDRSSPEAEGRVGLTGVDGIGLLSDSFPLPPGRRGPVPS